MAVTAVTRVTGHGSVKGRDLSALDPCRDLPSWPPSWPRSWAVRTARTLPARAWRSSAPAPRWGQRRPGRFSISPSLHLSIVPRPLAAACSAPRSPRVPPRPSARSRSPARRLAQGLSAARALVDNWPASAGALDVFVLEARGRLGVRGC